MKRTLVITLCFLAAICQSVNGTEYKWNLAVDREGIKVYTRPADGCPLEEFRGIIELKTSIETIEKILRDVNAQPTWMSKCASARVLKEFDRDHFVCYNLLSFPWPLSDRDILIDTRVLKEPGGKKLTFQMSVYPEDIIPLNKKHIRIKDFRAVCIVEQISESTCMVTYINRVNPMAPVPDSLANRIARKNPFETLQGLQRMVLSGRYQ